MTPPASLEVFQKFIQIGERMRPLGVASSPKSVVFLNIVQKAGQRARESQREPE